MTPSDAQPHADEIGAHPAVAVRLSDPAKVAHLMLVAALTSYDPGTEPWTVLHNAADEVNAALATLDADDKDYARLQGWLEDLSTVKGGGVPGKFS